jgi:transposase InsO family protein
MDEKPPSEKPKPQTKHKCEVYLNLAGRMTLTGINQLWVADITYVRLKGEFVYLAVILDRFSRKVVGWAVDRTISSRLTVAALERAVADRQPQAGLVHHSDRGLPYASPEYVAAFGEIRHGCEHEPPREPVRQGLRFTLHLLSTLRHHRAESSSSR